MHHIELLSPAKDLASGIEAINHGADAVYIGAPAFGARAAAGNSIADIEQLVRYAHTYHAKVYATVNTLLYDDELEPACQLLRSLYDIGTDAAIIQDLGLLQCDLPPIALHASTQTHNYDPRRIQFLQQAGFQRIILARETSLQQMEQLHRSTSVELEAFIHGALCVSFSGQCYLSLCLTGRSGNRGTCSQPCRSAYDLYAASQSKAEPRLISRNAHLLSLKDFNASQYVGSMIDAGITSFKIEGRLKDITYVKNITAYYRQLLDNEIEKRIKEKTPALLAKASSGHCTYTFTPDPARSFNRGFTTYFLEKRAPMASLQTPKALGTKVAEVVQTDGTAIQVRPVNPSIRFAAGDGLCYFDAQSTLCGFLVNGVSGTTIKSNRPLSLPKGTELWRNNDAAFERLLQATSATRKIGVAMLLDETPDGIALTLRDEDRCEGHAAIACDKQPARDPNPDNIKRQLCKLGDTPFEATSVTINLATPLFFPAAVLNKVRREAVQDLIERRLAAARPSFSTQSKVTSDIPYFETALDYRANVINSKAEQFYRQHGVQSIDPGLDKNMVLFDAVGKNRPTWDEAFDGKALMTTKYCLRYELGCCLKQTAKNGNGKIKNDDILLLRNQNRWLQLYFDCHHCQMTIQLATNTPTTEK